MFQDKNILIIGGTGTIGKAMVKRLLEYKPKVIRIFSRDEYKQFVMKDELKEHSNLRFLLGDVRDKERLERAMHGIDMVFHLAALKHVPACEYDPFEAVKTNVIGTQNVIECAIKNRVGRVVYTSSDKAVSPTNTMGATKLLAERLVSAANYSKGDTKTIFSTVRFGNVLGSRGSVLQLWKDQILSKRQITITDPEMTRFIMTVDDAVNLILEACKVAQGGEVFILKMPVIKLKDLAEVFIKRIADQYNIETNEVGIKIVGLRPGEKMYEELMSEDESMYAVEHENMYELKSLSNQIVDKRMIVSNLYCSKNHLQVTINELNNFFSKIIL